MDTHTVEPSTSSSNARNVVEQRLSSKMNTFCAHYFLAVEYFERQYSGSFSIAVSVFNLKFQYLKEF